jgi:predicted MFS family arabinose efflux permease
MVPFFFPGLPAIFVAAGMVGMATAFHNVSLHNLIGLLSKPDKRTQNYSYYSLTLATGALAGPLLVGFGIDHVGYGVTGLYLALIAVAPVAAPVIWGGALPGGMRDTATPTGNILHTLKDSNMLRVLATGGLVVAGIELFQFYMPIYTHSIGMSASAIGIVLAAYGAAAFAIRLVMRAVLTRITELELLAYSFYVSAASLVLVPFFQNVTLLALLAFTFGLGMGCGQPITMTLTFRTSAKGRSAEVLGLRIAINQGTRVIVPVVFGSIGSVFGLFPVFWIFALMLGSGGMLSRSKTIA